MTPDSTINQDSLFENYESEDIYDVIQQIERSFGISIAPASLEGVQTFGDLCDIIIDQINHTHKDDCTSQQVFYRIRQAMIGAGIPSEQIRPASKLNYLFPKQSRRKSVKIFQHELGVKIPLLTYPDRIACLLGIGIIVSLLAFFIDWKIALGGIAVFSFGFYIAGKTGNQLNYATVKQLTRLLTRDHYQFFRRAGNTVNKNEILQIIKQSFRERLAIREEGLTRDAPIIWQ